MSAVTHIWKKEWRLKRSLFFFLTYLKSRERLIYLFCLVGFFLKISKAKHSEFVGLSCDPNCLLWVISQ